MTSFVGLRPRLPRLRIAQVLAVSPLHMTARYGTSTDVGLNRVCRLDARRPVAELAGELSSFRPDVLAGYPSVLALLADEQLAGRLAVAPRHVFTSSEVRTPEMTARMKAAWGVSPLDLYATTETTIAAFECGAGCGLHLFEDTALIENVDERGRPVPDGEPGSRLLVTNLFNRTQPIIRYEVSDIARIDSEPCPCGRTLRRLVAVEGRSDDVLMLPGRNGKTVAVHPLAVRSPFAALSEVRQYQVVGDGARLLVRVVPHEKAAADAVTEHVRCALGRKLAELGVAPLEIEVEAVAEIARDRGHGGKFKLIESRTRP
jgi:phenylacetate-coenzyme A ligase PaaK-like adenylate-forming protein